MEIGSDWGFFFCGIVSNATIGLVGILLGNFAGIVSLDRDDCVVGFGKMGILEKFGSVVIWNLWRAPKPSPWLRPQQEIKL